MGYRQPGVTERGVIADRGVDRVGQRHGGEHDGEQRESPRRHHRPLREPTISMSAANSSTAANRDPRLGRYRTGQGQRGLDSDPRPDGPRQWCLQQSATTARATGDSATRWRAPPGSLTRSAVPRETTRPVATPSFRPPRRVAVVWPRRPACGRIGSRAGNSRSAIPRRDPRPVGRCGEQDVVLDENYPAAMS